jgi:superfamily II DNA or RNA helicase
MLEWAGSKPTELHFRMPEAGGLVIAPSIEMANYMVRLIERMEGEKPLLVHSQMPNPEAKIKAFRNTDKRWLVSVTMVSEGVDIKRLRVLLYLPHALTELAFRQAVGRVVRTRGPDDDTRAYVVMPSFDTFEAFARRVEEEMSPAARAGEDAPRSKRCPACHGACALGTRVCSDCGHEFPAPHTAFKPCPDCGALNTVASATCQACGASFAPTIVLTLDQALRNGAIVRGMDINEQEVQEAEEMAPKVRKLILRSGDDKLVRIAKLLPDESWARLRDIFAASTVAQYK